MKTNTKAQSFKNGILLILLVMGIFAFSLSFDKSDKMSGNMVKVTGMATATTSGQNTVLTAKDTQGVNNNINFAFDQTLGKWYVEQNGVKTYDSANLNKAGFDFEGRTSVGETKTNLRLFAEGLLRSNTQTNSYETFQAGKKFSSDFNTPVRDDFMIESPNSFSYRTDVGLAQENRIGDSWKNIDGSFALKDKDFFGISPSAPVSGSKATDSPTLTHVVEDGQNIESIALIYGVSEEELLESNGLEKGDIAEAGTELSVPYNEQNNDIINTLQGTVIENDDGTYSPNYGYEWVNPDDDSLDVRPVQSKITVGDTTYIYKGTTPTGLQDYADSSNPSIRGYRNAQGGIDIYSGGMHPAAPPSTINHVVEEGQDLHGLSLMYVITKEDLKKANNIGDGGDVTPGQIIKIPSTQTTDSPAPVTSPDDYSTNTANFESRKDLVTRIKQASKVEWVKGDQIGADPTAEYSVDQFGDFVSRDPNLPDQIKMYDSDEGWVYRVKRDDSLISIADKFDTTVESIMLNNPSITNKNKITIGSKLKIDEIPTAQIKVGSGETVNTLAETYGTTPGEIRRINSIAEDEDLSEGQIVTVPLETETTKYHVVSESDSLDSIARQQLIDSGESDPTQDRVDETASLILINNYLTPADEITQGLILDVWDVVRALPEETEEENADEIDDQLADAGLGDLTSGGSTQKPSATQTQLDNANSLLKRVQDSKAYKDAKSDEERNAILNRAALAFEKKNHPTAVATFYDAAGNYQAAAEQWRSAGNYEKMLDSYLNYGRTTGKVVDETKLTYVTTGMSAEQQKLMEEKMQTMKNRNYINTKPSGYWESIGGFLDKWTGYTTGYSGASFFYCDDCLWGNIVQRIDNEWVSAILGGTGGIANELCKIDVLDDVNGNNGYAFSSSVSGPSAHIEGEKINLINYSDPSNPKSTPLYKITFQVNPGNAAAGCKLSFAAYFGRTTPLLVGNSSNSVYQWSLEPGDSAISYAGSNMIVKISPNIYDEVCLKFTKISSKTEGSSSCLYGISEGDYLCNTIKEGTEQTYTDKDFESKNAWWNG